MKTKGLSRGEILLGMQCGAFKEGDRFKDVSPKGIGAIAKVVSDVENESVLVWEQNENCLQLRNCLTEQWDVLEEPLRVGDWVVFASQSVTCKVASIEDDESVYVDWKCQTRGNQLIPIDMLRKATPEEIVQEKRRRVFAKVGRDVNEFKSGDIVIGSAADLLEVEKVGKLLSCRQFHPTYQLFERFNLDKNSIKLVIPVEQRLDINNK